IRCGKGPSSARCVAGGPVTEAFEDAWSLWNGLGAVTMSSWTGAALAALEFAGVRGRIVLCPSNTLMANPLASSAAGGSVIFLIEECGRAHGAQWHGRRPGSWGDAGVWSLAATKTVSTGEGEMLVSRRDDVLQFARAFRDYGKPDYASDGLNFR